MLKKSKGLSMKIVLTLSLVLCSSFTWARNISSDGASCPINSAAVAHGLSSIIAVGDVVSDEMTFAQKICFRFTAAVSSETRDPIDTLKINVLKEMNQYTEGMDLDTDEVDTMVVKILNKESKDLICTYDSTYNIYLEEHFYKRAIAEHSLVLFDDFLTETD